ncbi:MAG: hypothetical protein GXO85_04235 [Chlorobi bacterium]|nr:hypothetical protein [Chlorobiota bacterium]
MKHAVIFSTLYFLFITSSIYSQFDFFEPKTKVSGYGELHYNVKQIEGKEISKTLDFHRFVVFLNHSFTEKWSFSAEVELEHNFVQNGQGELSLEQAYLNYHMSQYLGFQAGVILNSVGLINEYHEPPLFLSVERPLYNKYIVPTTWSGNGISAYGMLSGLEYKLNIMEGLNSDNFNLKSGIRDGRQKGFKANAKNPLYNFKLDYFNIPGLKVGASATYNRASGDSTEIPIQLYEFHAQFNNYNIIMNFEYGNIFYSNSELKESRGFYVDLGYNIASFLKWKSKLIPFARYSDINTASTTISGGESEQKYHNKLWIIGISFLPIPSIALKGEYSENTVELNSIKTQYFNLGIGYMF